MSDNINVYTCEKSIKDSGHQESFIDTILNIEKSFYEYEYFISEVETFFNDQLEDGDIEKFKGEVFELCDPGTGVQFPFCIKDNKLKFVETEAWRSIILSSLSINKTINMTDNLKRKTRH
jgi:hypothetical protein